MDAERWKRVDDLLQAALQVPAGRQEEFLRQQCGDDPDLLEDVRSLLTSHRKVGSFLEAPLAVPPPARSSVTGQTISHYRVLGHWAQAAWELSTRRKILYWAGWLR
jgi:hypothetical protein